MRHLAGGELGGNALGDFADGLFESLAARNQAKKEQRLETSHLEGS